MFNKKWKRKPQNEKILALEILHHLIGDFESIFIYDNKLL